MLCCERGIQQVFMQVIRGYYGIAWSLLGLSATFFIDSNRSQALAAARGAALTAQALDADERFEVGDGA